MYTRLTHGIFMPCNTAFDLWCWMFICCCYGYFIHFIFFFWCSYSCCCRCCLRCLVLFVRSFVRFVHNRRMNTQHVFESFVFSKVLYNKRRNTKENWSTRYWKLSLLLPGSVVLIFQCKMAAMAAERKVRTQRNNNIGEEFLK